MKTVWTSGMNEEQKEELKSSFYASNEIRKRLKEILTMKYESARVEMRSKDTYESPNWAFKQADLCGYERALNEVISLIEN